MLAEGDGVVTKVDATNVSVKYDSGESKDYKLIKFLRSNHGTCINQKPIVSVGERVHGGDDRSDTATPGCRNPPESCQCGEAHGRRLRW